MEDMKVIICLKSCVSTTAADQSLMVNDLGSVEADVSRFPSARITARRLGADSDGSNLYARVFFSLRNVRRMACLRAMKTLGPDWLKCHVDMFTTCEIRKQYNKVIYISERLSACHPGMMIHTLNFVICGLFAENPNAGQCLNFFKKNHVHGHTICRSECCLIVLFFL